MRNAERDSLRQQQASISIGPSESRIMAQDSDLDEYDRALGRDQSGLGLESDAEDDGRGVVDGKEGVLGMLAQFTKAKTEKGIDI